MNEDIILDLDNKLAEFFDPDLALILSLLNDITKKNSWTVSSGERITTFAQSYFISIEAPEIQFLLSVRKICVFVQKYFTYISLYVDAIYNAIIANKPSTSKKYTKTHFIKSLMQAEICYWESEKYHCICCLFAKRPKAHFESFIQKNHNETILKTVLDLKRSNTKAIKKNMLKQLEKMKCLSNSLLYLRQFCLEGALHINRTYADLEHFLRENTTRLQPSKADNDISSNFLELFINKLHFSIIQQLDTLKRLDCLPKSIVNTSSDYYTLKLSYYKKLLQNKKQSTQLKLNDKKTENRKNVKKKKAFTPTPKKEKQEKSDKDLKNKNESVKVAEIKLMSINLALKVRKLKEQFQNTSNNLEYHKDTAESWLRQAEKRISYIQCSLHGSADCNLCLDALPEKNFHRFSSEVEEKAKKLSDLKQKFEKCYLCAHDFAHEKHFSLIKDLNKNIVDEKNFNNDLKDSEEKVRNFQQSVNTFISCCGEVDVFYDETVPNCCNFHQKWERLIKSAKKAYGKATVIPKKEQCTMGEKNKEKTNKRGLSSLYQQAQGLEKELTEILDSVSSQSEVMAEILNKVSDISEHHNYLEEMENAKSVLDVTQKGIVQNGYETCKKLHQHLHRDVVLINRCFVLDIRDSRKKLSEIKKKYTQFLDSCDAINQICTQIFTTKENDPSNLIAGLKYQEVPGDGHCLFHAIALYTGHSVNQLRELTANFMKVNAQEFIQYFNGKKEDFYCHIDMIRNSNEWGDAMEIEALQRALEQPIVIFSPEGIVTPSNILTFTKPPIFILYNGVHYDALLVCDGYKGEKILCELLDDKNNSFKKLPIYECCNFHKNLAIANKSALFERNNDPDEALLLNDKKFHSLSQYLPAFLIDELELEQITDKLLEHEDSSEDTSESLRTTDVSSDLSSVFYYPNTFFSCNNLLENTSYLYITKLSDSRGYLFVSLERVK